ncbi:MAG TPA: hypothetical protein VK364_06705, partial [Hymenobacter sp.]|nr:hypothetical protein [Hymenobacter sp.]
MSLSIMNQFFLILSLLLLGFTNGSFQLLQGELTAFNRTDSGIEYRVYQKQNGRYTLRTAVDRAGDPTYTSRIGRVLSVHVQYRTGKDSTLFNSRRQLRMPVQIPLAELKVKGGLEEALALLQ